MLVFVLESFLVHAREPPHSNSAVIVWWLQSASVQNSGPSC